MMYPNVFCRYSKKTPASEDSVRHAPSEDTMLYPIDVMESTDTHVKIHYTGYSLKFDEWRARMSYSWTVHALWMAMILIKIYL